MRHDRLKCFLYLLGRDHLPLGVVNLLDQRAVEEPVVYSDPDLANWAERLAASLTRQSIPDCADPEAQARTPLTTPKEEPPR